MTGAPRGLMLAAILAIPAFALQQPAGKDDRAARLKEMNAQIRAIKIEDTSRPEHKPESVTAEPLHRWNDPTRDFSDGALWAFGTSGRPVAIGTMELYGTGTPYENWSFELIAVAP